MKNNAFLNRVRRIPLIDLFLNLEGNPKALILMEPLWGIPRTLLIPFTTLYMKALGVDEIKIGLALSFSMILRVIFAGLAGFITDKIGRKRATMLCDVIAWVIPSAIWAVAQNYWFFLAAMAFNSFDIGMVAWNCFWVEDSRPEDILGISNWMTIAGLVSVFVSPISGLLVRHFSLVPVVRAIYVMFFILMVVKVFVTWKFTHETQQGKIRMEETKNQSVFEFLSEYRTVVPTLWNNSGVLRTLVIMVITYVNTTVINDNFFSIYAKDTLQISESVLANLPILRALVMMAFMFGIQHILEYLPFKIPLAAGFVVNILAQCMLIFGVPLARLTGTKLWILVVYTLLEAVSFAMINPRKEQMQAHYIPPEERARTNSILTSLMLAFSIPFGSIAGVLSHKGGAYPFILNAALLLVGFILVVGFQGDLEKETL